MPKIAVFQTLRILTGKVMFAVILLYLICTFISYSLTSASSYKNNELSAHVRPVIGVLTQPKDAKEDQAGSNWSNVDASYVRWLQSAGAVLSPILFNSTEEEMKSQFRQLSGIYFTGGPDKPTDFDRYYSSSGVLLNLAIEFEIPVWGTCLGLQTISDLTAGKDVLGDYDSENYSLALELNPSYSSRLMSSLPESAQNILTTTNSTTNWHHYGVSPSDFAKYLEPAGYRIVSTNKDKQGLEFVSTYEHKTLPIYAVQWHPEANAHSGDHECVEHDTQAIAAMQSVAIFFVQECRSKGVGPGDRPSAMEGPAPRDIDESQLYALPSRYTYKFIFE
jgi:gamma-glutamyl hydrolase